jgi:hypothetical protein
MSVSTFNYQPKHFKVLRVINIEETIEYITHMLTMDNVLYAQPTYPIGSDGRSRYESGLRCVNSTSNIKSISYSKEELKIIIDKTIDFYKHNFSLTKKMKDKMV